MSRADTIFQIPETVKQDVQAYRPHLEKLLQGQTAPLAFRGYRVPHGIYEQRQAGKFMVRVRIPAGMILPDQIDCLAKLSRKFGDGVLHITTRQDVQIHKVDIADTAEVLEVLLPAGLSARGGGGNTVRNITACPRAGVCPKQVFDIRPYVVALSEYLLAFANSFNLPRKFKVAFSGCPRDCALACVADLGFFAETRNSSHGFAVYAAGGMGANSSLAEKIEDFVEASEIFEVAEAIKRLFDEHGDRTNKHRARLRFVLARLGREEFIKQYCQQRQELAHAKLTTPQIRQVPSLAPSAVPDSPQPGSGWTDRAYQTWLDDNVLPENKAGHFTVRLRAGLGDIPADDFQAIAALARQVGEGFVRTTQTQDLLLCRVRQADLPTVFSTLGRLTMDFISAKGPKLVACAGASTCRLGLCRSRDLANAIAAELVKNNGPVGFGDLTIKISGCPNSCGQHHIGAVGLQGRAKRVAGKLVPCYEVLIGGQTGQDKGRFGRQIGVVPAKSIPSLLWSLLDFSASSGKAQLDFASLLAENGEQIAKLVKQHSHIPPVEQNPQVYCDFGSSEEFSLAGRGPGECGAGVMDVIQLDIDQAKQALERFQAATADKSKSQDLYETIVSSARALLITRGLEPKKDREIFQAFAEQFIEPGWFTAGTKDLLNAALDYRLGDTDTIAHLAKPATEMFARVEELYHSLDGNLNFRAKPIGKLPEESPPTGDKAVDLRGVACPLNFAKAKIELDKIPVGQVLEILLDGGQTVCNVPVSFSQQGQEILEVKQDEGFFRLKVRRIQ